MMNNSVHYPILFILLLALLLQTGCSGVQLAAEYDPRIEELVVQLEETTINYMLEISIRIEEDQLDSTTMGISNHYFSEFHTTYHDMQLNARLIRFLASTKTKGENESQVADSLIILIDNLIVYDKEDGFLLPSEVPLLVTPITLTLESLLRMEKAYKREEN